MKFTTFERERVYGISDPDPSVLNIITHAQHTHQKFMNFPTIHDRKSATHTRSSMGQRQQRNFVCAQTLFCSSNRGRTAVAGVARVCVDMVNPASVNFLKRSTVSCLFRHHRHHHHPAPLCYTTHASTRRCTKRHIDSPLMQKVRLLYYLTHNPFASDRRGGRVVGWSGCFSLGFVREMPFGAVGRRSHSTVLPQLRAYPNME